jgi:NADH-quinone oxidoreductase subunit N
VFDAAVKAGLFPLAAVGIAASTIGAYYYLRVVKTMYFDDPAPAFAKGEDSAVEGGLIAVAAVIVSPLGYLAIPALAAWSMAAARALFPLG